jgi:cyclin-dependent kinase-like
LREIRILKSLKQDNIVSLLEVFRRNRKLYLVFEYVERTILEDLEKNPNGMDKLDVKKVFYQLLRALDFIHTNNVTLRHPLSLSQPCSPLVICLLV